MEDKRLQNLFSDHISEEDMRDFLNQLQSDQTLIKMRRGSIVYIIIQVKDKEPESLLEVIQKAANVINANHGFIPSILSSIIVVTFGFPFKDSRKAIQNQQATVDELLRHFKEDVKIVYGTEDGYYGNVSIIQGWHYTPILRGIGDKFGRLSKLQFGNSLKL